MSHYISSGNSDHSCVRSLFYFGPFHHFSPSEWKWLFKSFKLVRVLELGWNCCEFACSRKIPANLGNFIHLRYLRIDPEFIRTVPASIFTLCNLLTLDFGNLRFRIPVAFPNGMCKLKLLRHLYANGPIKLCGNRHGAIMWNLQTISCMVLDRQTASLIAKGRFPKLRKLGLQISSEYKHKRELPKFLLSMQQLSHLSKLEIRLDTNTTLPSSSDNMEREFGIKPQEFMQSLEKFTCLSKLKIVNVLDLPTCAVAFPSNISKLTLTSITRLNDEWINALGKLAKLRVLRLSATGFWFSKVLDSFDLNICFAGGFPQLQVFYMKGLIVQNWKLANGAMPRLQSLVIDNCQSLDDLPNELWSLTDLRKVQVKEPSEALVHMLQNLELKNGCDCEVIV